jgi:hypothetical protein
VAVAGQTLVRPLVQAEQVAEERAAITTRLQPLEAQTLVAVEVAVVSSLALVQASAALAVPV